jgi:hypothetical protein
VLKEGAWHKENELFVALPKFKVKKDLVLTQVGARGMMYIW